jgi:hypothetical protein
MKIHPVEAQLFHADRQTDTEMDGRTDMTNLTVVVRNFANVPTKYNQIWGKNMPELD